jgi:5'-methylthioadenosine phosphorylase
MEERGNMKLGIIGGTGLENLGEFQIKEVIDIQTPFGSPSERITIGQLGRTEIAFLPRHGTAHQHSPSELPYRANIYALKQLGVTHLLTVSAVGSLKAELPPRSVVLPDQIIDRTVGRPRTFFETGVVAHVGIADPYCSCFGDAVAEAADRARRPLVRSGTYVCIEGPQFSTKAESHLYRSWNASVIGMTAMPEARLAREAEFCYATLAMVTDYDVWHDTEGPVTVEMVGGNLKANAEAGRAIIQSLAEQGLSPRHCECGDALRNAIVTSPAAITTEVRQRLGVVAERYLGTAS